MGKELAICHAPPLWVLMFSMKMCMFIDFLNLFFSLIIISFLLYHIDDQLATSECIFHDYFFRYFYPLNDQLITFLSYL